MEPQPRALGGASCQLATVARLHNYVMTVVRLDLALTTYTIITHIGSSRSNRFETMFGPMVSRSLMTSQCVQSSKLNVSEIKMDVECETPVLVSTSISDHGPKL
ncbi:hypothetical protein TNCV_755091 [Trichonephila clavipes]|nr:hypothetical protein TNCV_755091 [Trichonephila clavipes]